MFLPRAALFFPGTAVCASADWFIRTSATDVCVTLPLNFGEARGVPPYKQSKNVAQSCRLGSKAEYVY